MAFYRMGVDGDVQKLGALAGNFVFGGSVLPQISPNGQYVIYARNDQATQVIELHLAHTDGSGDTVVDQQPALNGLAWAPDSNHYAYTVLPSGGGGGFPAPVEGPLQTFAPGATVLSLKWWDETSFIFHGQVDGQWGLYFQRLGEALRLEVGGLSRDVRFDVRR